MKFYFALMELDTDKVNEKNGMRIVSAMEELKTAFAGIGEVTYVEVAQEMEYRRVERELKQQVGK